MPLYEYQCRQCGRTMEIRHGFRESTAARCDSCGGELRRVFSPAGIVFKGSGFYVTDSRARNSGGQSPSAERPDASKSEPAPAASASAAESAPKKPDGDKPQSKKKPDPPKSDAAA